MNISQYVEYRVWASSDEGREINKPWEKLRKILDEQSIDYFEDGNDVYINRNQLGGVVDKHRHNEASKRKRRHINSLGSGRRRALVYDCVMRSIQHLDDGTQRSIIEAANDRLKGNPKDKLRYSEIEFFSNIHPKLGEYRDSLYTDVNTEPTPDSINPGRPVGGVSDPNYQSDRKSESTTEPGSDAPRTGAAAGGGKPDTGPQAEDPPQGNKPKGK